MRIVQSACALRCNASPCRKKRNRRLRCLELELTGQSLRLHIPSKEAAPPSAASEGAAVSDAVQHSAAMAGCCSHGGDVDEGSDADARVERWGGSQIRHQGDLVQRCCCCCAYCPALLPHVVSDACGLGLTAPTKLAAIELRAVELLQNFTR